MSGRARSRARGQRRWQDVAQLEAPGAAAAGAAGPDPQAVPVQLGLQPRREEGQAVAPEPRCRGAEGGAQPAGVEERHLTAGLRSLSVSSREPTGVFRDLVVNTRNDLKHVKHSKRGSEGTVMELIANHFPVTLPGSPAYQYNVEYRPNIRDRNLRENLLCEHEAALGTCWIFDGNSLLLPRSLQGLRMEFVSQTQDIGAVRIRVWYARKLTPDQPDFLRYLNILFRRILKLMNLEQIGRNYYSGTNSFPSHKLEVRRGIVSSILSYENSLTLCSDICHKLVRSETVYDLIESIRNENLSQREFREKVSKKLVGSIVIAKYNNKTYRVDGINWDQSPRDTFTKSDGSVTTFVNYYMQQYGKLITTFNQPLLESWGRWRRGQWDMPQEPVLLVPQLCCPTGLTDNMRHDRKLMEALTTYMQPSPWIRKKELQHFINEVGGNGKAQNKLCGWGLSIDTDCLHVSGRILKNLRIFQKNVSFDVNPNLRDWLKDSRSAPLLRVESLSHWVLLYTSACVRHARTFVNCLQTVTPVMGITMERANMYEVHGDPDSYISVLRRCVTPHTKMVVCVLPDEEKYRYDEIKKFLCTQCPVPSQCVVAETLVPSRILLTVTTKIAQQMNCKMGGALWMVDIGLQKTMFVGIDCFHDIEHRQQSIAGFVASTSEDLTTWYSQCVFQEPGQELVDGLMNCLEAALDSWLKNVPHEPDSIVVYRDGVGDGQLQALLNHEVAELLQCLKAHKHHIKLTFIVVKKRINTRFFVTSEKIENPPSGTVVDEAVTRQEWYDFYIVSQSSKKGTVTPTHYNVIYDTACLDPDTVQRLTYSLCHMYYNFPGIIRVPAPCHYAHKLAYLVGQNVQQQPHRSLSNSLYYL